MNSTPDLISHSLSLSLSTPHTYRKFEKLSDLMSEEYNWKLYRAELEACFARNIPCIPFLGVLLTTIVQQESATISRGGQMSRHGRKRVSGVEMYTILEAITVRNRLVLAQKKCCNWMIMMSHFL